MATDAPRNSSSFIIFLLAFIVFEMIINNYRATERISELKTMVIEIRGIIEEKNNKQPSSQEPEARLD